MRGQKEKNRETYVTLRVDDGECDVRVLNREWPIYVTKPGDIYDMCVCVRTCVCVCACLCGCMDCVTNRMFALAFTH